MMLGEIIVVALVCLVFLILDKAGLAAFDTSVILGAILGAAIILINYTILIISVDVQINKFVESRGDAEMSEEEIAAFSKKGSASVQNAIKISMFLRTGSMLLALVLAFLTGWFNLFATAIPLFAFRPLLTVVNLLQSRNEPAPDPSKFIRYDDEDDEINEEKEEN